MEETDGDDDVNFLGINLEYSERLGPRTDARDDPLWKATHGAEPPFDATLLEAWGYYAGTQTEFIAEMKRLIAVLEAHPE